MSMKRVLLFLVGMGWWVDHSYSQNCDTTTCGELGVVIGSNDLCEGCCYIWSPTVGLNDYTIKNPTAFPKTETIYSVTVMDVTWLLKEQMRLLLDCLLVKCFFPLIILYRRLRSLLLVPCFCTLEGVNSPSDIELDTSTNTWL